MTKKKNTATPRDAESTTPILDSLHTGNWVKCRCRHADAVQNPAHPDYLCRNWNGDSKQEPQPCPVEPADYMSCQYLAKTKKHEVMA